MPGTNRAKSDNLIFAVQKNSEKRCIFISHKKEDEAIAVALGDFIMNTFDVDIYLDINDCVLQEAVSEENDKAIVASIQRGISCSDGLICIISDKTRMSWWVPYEVGFAEEKMHDIGSSKIASIKLKTIPDFPSFLKTKKTISSTRDLTQFLQGFTRYGNFLGQYNYNKEDVSIKILESYFG